MIRRALGSFEFSILTVLLNRPLNAYGGSIKECLDAGTEHEVAFGAVYTALDRLEAKGFVHSWWGEPTAERGGRRKRYYQITNAGRQAVRRTATLYSHSDSSIPAMGAT
jgi:PadR family transcriptional regulator PadR